MKCGSFFLAVLLGIIAAVHIEAEFLQPRFPFASVAAESPAEELWQSRLNIRFPRGTSRFRGSASESHEETHHQSSGGRVRRSDGSLNIDGSASSHTDNNGDTSASGNLDVQGSTSNGNTLSLTGSADGDTNGNLDISEEGSLHIGGSGSGSGASAQGGSGSSGSGSGSLTGELNLGGSQKGAHGSGGNGSGEGILDDCLDLSIGDDLDEDLNEEDHDDASQHKYDGITGAIRRVIDNILRILNIGNSSSNQNSTQGKSGNLVSINGHNVATIGNNTVKGDGQLTIDSGNSLVSRVINGVLQLPYRLILLVRYLIRVSVQVVLLPLNIVRRMLSYMVQGFIHISYN